jgi:energy-coupling factor transporter ATP-binding protein EcfA2
LFSGDIQQNITLGEEGELAEVERVARQLHLHELIRDLPQGYATPVRERGSNLSSGQKQLISFVRTLWRDPKILVLDEATASLDVGTEALIQSALETLLRDRRQSCLRPFFLWSDQVEQWVLSLDENAELLHGKHQLRGGKSKRNRQKGRKTASGVCLSSKYLRYPDLLFTNPCFIPLLSAQAHKEAYL